MTERGGADRVEEKPAGGGGVGDISREPMGSDVTSHGGSGGGADEPVEGRSDAAERGADRPSEAG